MSIEAVKDFYEKIASDEKFQNKLNELQDKATKGLELPLAQDKKEEITKEVIIPFAKEQGFDFSIEDVKEFEKSIVEQLDEEQLENISAGGGGLGLSGCIFLGGGFGVWYHRGYMGICFTCGIGLGCGSCKGSGSGEQAAGMCFILGDDEAI